MAERISLIEPDSPEGQKGIRKILFAGVEQMLGHPEFIQNRRSCSLFADDDFAVHGLLAPPGRWRHADDQDHGNGRD